MELPTKGLCAVTLWPAKIAPGAPCMPDISYALMPRRKGVVTDIPFSMVSDQTLVGFITHHEDASAGWILDVNGFALAVDPMHGTRFSDLPFSLFHTVAGLAIAAEIADRIVVEQVTVTASARLIGKPAPMRHGITVLFTDKPCSGKRSDYHRRYLSPPSQEDRVEGASISLAPIQMVVVEYKVAGAEGGR
jgi:hypothetical protein